MNFESGKVEITIPFFICLILFVIVAFVFILFLIKRSKDLKCQLDELKNINHKLELQVHPLQLESIKYKLIPHLFKNVLNSIQSHAYQTYYSLDKLANVLDYVLYESDQQMVSLKEEIEFVLNLIEINRIKVSPLFDLRIKNKIDKHDKWFEEKLIAPLITTDLIENAFKHSDLQSSDAFISIVFEVTDDWFILTVTNKVSPTPGIKKEKGGFGKQNLKKRLDIIYKTFYKLDQFAKEDIYIGQLKINLNGYKAEMYSS